LAVSTKHFIAARNLLNGPRWREAASALLGIHLCHGLKTAPDPAHCPHHDGGEQPHNKDRTEHKPRPCLLAFRDRLFRAGAPVAPAFTEQ
jgi:hypothetical protein